MERTLGAIEEEHTQMAETPSIEINKEEPARTSYKPVLAVFVAPFFCLSLFSWFPLLLRRVQHSNNTQGILYNPSWQPLSCPFSPQASSASQPVLSFCNIILTHQTQSEVNKPLVSFQ